MYSWVFSFRARLVRNDALQYRYAQDFQASGGFPNAPAPGFYKYARGR